MDLKTKAAAELQSSVRAQAEAVASVAEPLARLAGEVAERLHEGGKLLSFGNGGSAADAQHLAAEFVIRLGRDRPAMAAVALNADTSVLTAGANDYGYEEVFARQVEALGRARDVAVGISTSGLSENVRRGLVRACELGLFTTAFLGSGGGTVAAVVDLPIVVPLNDARRVQEVHITMCHALVALVEEILFGP